MDGSPDRQLHSFGAERSILFKNNWLRSSGDQLTFIWHPSDQQCCFPSCLIFLEDNALQFRTIRFCTSGPSEPVSFFQKR